MADLLGLGTVFAAGINAVSQRETNDMNARLAAQANQWNIEQWMRQNEYNTPENQVARLRAAGLNPNLAVSNGASSLISGGQAGEIKPANVASMNPVDMSVLSNLDSLSIQRDVADSEIAKNEADAEESRSRVPVHQQEVQQIKTLIDKSQAEIDEIKRRTDLYDVQEFVTLQDSHMNMLMTLQSMAESESRKELTDKEVDHFDERLRVELARQRAETKKLISDSKFIDAQVEKIKQEMKIASEDRKIELAEKFGPNPTAEHVREVLQKESESYFSELEGDLKEARYQKSGYSFIATRIQRHWQGFIGPMFGAGLDTYKASRSPKAKIKPKPVG